MSGIEVSVDTVDIGLPAGPGSPAGGGPNTREGHNSLPLTDPRHPILGNSDDEDSDGRDEPRARRRTSDEETEFLALLAQQDRSRQHNAYDDLKGRPTGESRPEPVRIERAKPQARPPLVMSPAAVAEPTPAPAPFRRAQQDQAEANVVFLNLYDLPYLGAGNTVTRWLGVPAFHSGVQVFGREYGYGGHDEDYTGIYEVEPRSAENYKFRESVLMGRTMLTPAQVHNLMGTLQAQFKGNEYDVTTRNCNHFSDVLVMHLVGRPIPSYVNRLARGMSFFAAPIALLPNKVTRISRSSQSSNSIRASRAANKADREAEERARINRMDADPDDDWD